MTLSPIAQLKVAAVLMAALALLGCEATSSTASEQAVAVYPAISAAPAPALVAVSNVTAEAEPEQPADTVAAPVALSGKLQEVVKLAQSGVSDDVIVAYVENSPTPFNPSPEEIVYLTDV